MIRKYCHVCRVPFEARTLRAKYCSPYHGLKAFRLRRRASARGETLAELGLPNPEMLPDPVMVPRKLTGSELKFVEYTAQGLGHSEAVRRSYDPSQHTVNVSDKGGRLMMRPEIRNAIERKKEQLAAAMDRQGLTPDFVAEKLREGLDIVPEATPSWNSRMQMLKEVNKLQDFYPHKDQGINARLAFVKNLFQLNQQPNEPIGEPIGEPIERGDSQNGQ